MASEGFHDGPGAPRRASPRAMAFDAALREVALPVLAAQGFRFDGSRTFRRIARDGRSADILHFQLGQRSMEGLFTVNLGVYVEGDSAGIAAAKAREFHCAPHRRMRLGVLMPGWSPALAQLPWIGFLFGPRDRWWRLAENAAHMQASMTNAVDAIVRHGLPWLERNAERGERA